MSYIITLLALVFYYKPLLSVLLICYYTSRGDEENTTKYKAKLYDWYYKAWETLKW